MLSASHTGYYGRFNFKNGGDKGIIWVSFYRGSSKYALIGLGIGQSALTGAWTDVTIIPLVNTINPSIVKAMIDGDAYAFVIKTLEAYTVCSVIGTTGITILSTSGVA